MSNLRSVFETLGYLAVRTHLQSGNVVFDSAEGVDNAAVQRLENAIAHRTGAKCRVTVLDCAHLRRIAAENPLADAADPSRMIVTFIDPVPPESSLDRPSDAALFPERLIIGENAIYQWCPEGVSKSRLPPRFFAALGATATARNLRTVTRLIEMLDE